MVHIRITQKEGVTWAIESTGHAFGGHGGGSAACAAVSVVLKGCGQAFLANESIRVEGSAAEPGRFTLAVDRDGLVDEPTGAYCKAVWAVVEGALQTAADSWPNEIVIERVER